MQSSSTEQKQKQRLTCYRLPLTVYREVAAHLRQVIGVDTELIMRSIEHDPAEKFDYYQSQVAALEINYNENIENNTHQRVAEILDHYARRYSPWEKSLNDESRKI